MKNLKVGILAAAVSITIAGSVSADEAPSFVADGRLVACIDPTFPPLEFMENVEDESPVGFDVDMLGALALEWGVELELVLLEFSGLLPALEAGRCDIMASGAVMNAERQERFGATPYMNTSYVILGRGDVERSFESYQDFSGESVAVQAGSLLEKVLDEANEALESANMEPITISPYPKATDVIQQVIIGRVIGGTSLDTEFAFRDMQNPGELSILFTDPDSQQYTAYFRKEPVGDQAIVDAAIQSLLSSGRLQEIGAKWNLRPEAFEGL